MFAVLMMACNETKTNSEAIHNNSASSLEHPDSDTLVLSGEDEEDEPLPKTVDETFDDFIFDFAQSKKMQLSRINFPISYEEDGKAVQLVRKKWKHEYLFLKQDYYTTLFGNESQLDMEKDSNLKQVDVEWILLEKKKFKTYHFERQQGMWKLVKVSMHTFAETEMADFLNFYQKFATDSVFQRNSIEQPLRFVTQDPEDDFGTIEGTLDIEQWYAFRPVLPMNTITNIRFGQQYSNPNRMVLVKRGIANGMMDMFLFEKKEHQWMLVSYEN